MSNAPSERANLTDSPWLWLMIFSVTALFLTTVIAPKYAVRMARKERMMHANETIAVARQAGVNAAEVEHAAPPVIPYVDEDYTKRPEFGVMYALLIGLFVVGACGLVRARRRAPVVAAPEAAA